MDKSLPVVSTFSGLGFLDLGLEAVGYDIQVINDVHSAFLDNYIYARDAANGPVPQRAIRGSLEDSAFAATIKSWKREHRDQIRGIVGGPPCPDFSVAGKQRGAAGDHGRLSEVYVNFAIEQKFDWILFENVKGLWRTRKHRAFYDHLKAKLSNADYLVADRLSNALEYGVPQDRHRIFLVAFHKRVLNKNQKAELASGEFPWEAGMTHALDEVYRCPWPTRNAFGTKPILPKGCPKELMVDHWFRREGMKGHTNAQSQFQPRAGLRKFLTIDEGDDSGKSSKRLHRFRYSPTAAYGNNEVHLHPYLPRRISAAEAMAIQSLPTWFTLDNRTSLTDMFKGIGNGVPFQMARGIGVSMRRFLDS